ncbi:MAG TPA: hypothetical protein VMU92_00575 [Acidobacteriaceae bacterium]|nr:hypothetical protein [Acidobacteriaceae bacterium]
MLRLTLVVSCCLCVGVSYGAQLPLDAPLAAPDLHIPGTAIPYAVDEYKGKLELVPIHHSTVSVNRHFGANWFKGTTESIFYRPEMTTKIPGQHARVQLHTLTPVLYMHIDVDPEGDNGGKNALTEKIALLHLKIAKDHRRVSKLTTNAWGGHAKRNDGVVKIRIESLPGGWIRVTRVEPLSPGEYAVSAMPQNQAFFETNVYDFGINKDAPENKEAITSDASN